MTRKKFVKQLMSIGYSRNDAAKEARAAVCAGLAYDERYFAVLNQSVANSLQMPIEQLDLAIERMLQQIEYGVKLIVEMLPPVIEHINAAIPQLIANMERLRREAEAATE